MTDIFSDIKIPDSRIAREAAELVRQHESELLFNHSVRVFMFGAMKGLRQDLKFDPELLYVAALFHDLGLVNAYHTDTKRFEVDGADAARAFLKSHGIPNPKADLVWEAIALHTTPEIPQFMQPGIHSRTRASWSTSSVSATTSIRQSSVTRCSPRFLAARTSRKISSRSRPARH